MKPRLKLTGNRQITLLDAGTERIDEELARTLLIARYGSVRQFGERFGFSYEAVSRALRPYGKKCAGRVSDIRQMLRLDSEPSAVSIKLVERCAQRRLERQPDFVFQEWQFLSSFRKLDANSQKLVADMAAAAAKQGQA